MEECIMYNTVNNAATSTSGGGEPAVETCPAVGYQKVSVCVPVTVTPFANPGRTKTKCCGEPKVTPNATTCPGTKNGVCSFTISQTLCIEVPVVFGATPDVGDTFVDCMGASSENICFNCDRSEPM